MKAIEIRDKNVDGEAATERIMKAAKAKRSSKGFPKGLDRELAKPLQSQEDAVSALAGETKSYLAQMNKSWLALPEDSIASDKPVVGPLLVLIKRLIKKAISWYVDEVAGRASNFNSLATNALYDIDNRTVYLESTTDQLKRELTERVRRLERRPVSGAKLKTKKKETVEDSGISSADPLDYFLFEERFRGSSESISSRQAPFADVFRGAEKVLDAGCGRGEFLAILESQGIDAYGIDTNIDMVMKCRDKGLKAETGSIVSHLDGLKGNSLGGIFLGQVVEHLKPNDLVSLVRLASEKLKPGAYFVAETVNPQSLSVLARSFYIDITHEKPVHPETLKFLLETEGFVDIKVEFISPLTNSERLHELPLSEDLSAEETARRIIENENTAKLNNLLFGFQDYVIIAKKP